MAKNIIVRDLTKSQNEKLDAIKDFHEVGTSSGAVLKMIEHHMAVVERNRALEDQLRAITNQINYLKDAQMQLDSAKQRHEDELNNLLNNY